MTPEDYDLNYSALAADYTALNTKYTALRLTVLTSFSLDGSENLEEQIRDYARVRREVERNAVASKVYAAVQAEREACAKIADEYNGNFKGAITASSIAAAIRARNGAQEQAK